MTKQNVLNQMQAKSFDQGKYSDGQGLWLCKSRKEAGRWMLRLVVEGRRREMGLGRWPDVSIAEAREKASEARKSVRNGIDPIAERAKARSRTARLTVAEAVEGCFQARQADLKDDGKAGRWLSPLNIHVLPEIGKLAIEDLDQHVLRQLLEPLWHDKAHTARKAMNRINLTLQHAAALGLDVDLQASMKAQALLGKQRHTTKHIPSMPYDEVASFYQWLAGQPHASCLALRFLILTATRTGEVRFATSQEVKDDVWVISAERTKTGREHRVPLSTHALQVIEQSQQTTKSKYLFPSPTGKAMSDATMSRLMERERHEARPHGFRASFRTWVEEQTETEYEVKETALGHKVDAGIVGAYQRSDRLEKRRILMNQWSEFVTKT